MGAAAVPLMVGGGLLSAYGSVQEGKAKRKANYATAAELVSNAGQLQAAGHVAGEEELRKTELLQSRMLAVAGASGAGVLDPTIIKLASDAQAEGELAASTRRYNADVEADSMRRQAGILRAEGDAHRRAGNIRAFGSLLSMGAAFK